MNYKRIDEMFQGLLEHLGSEHEPNEDGVKQWDPQCEGCRMFEHIGEQIIKEER